MPQTAEERRALVAERRALKPTTPTQCRCIGVPIRYPYPVCFTCGRDIAPEKGKRGGK